MLVNAGYFETNNCLQYVSRKLNYMGRSNRNVVVTCNYEDEQVNWRPNVCLLEASFRTKCFKLYATEVSHFPHHRWCEALTFHPVNLRANSTDFLAEFGNK